MIDKRVEMYKNSALFIFLIIVNTLQMFFISVS